MKMRGVMFDIEQTFETKILSVILGTFVERYTWYSIKEQNEVWSDESGSEFFEQNVYDGMAFRKKIGENHYVIFLKLQAYNAEDVLSYVHDYNDFLQSKCQILVLINDGEFVEIYAKNAELLTEIYQKAIENGFKNIRYITPSNEKRVQMNVL